MLSSWLTSMRNSSLGWKRMRLASYIVAALCKCVQFLSVRAGYLPVCLPIIFRRIAPGVAEDNAAGEYINTNVASAVTHREEEYDHTNHFFFLLEESCFHFKKQLRMKLVFLLLACKTITSFLHRQGRRFGK